MEKMKSTSLMAPLPPRPPALDMSFWRTAIALPLLMGAGFGGIVFYRGGTLLQAAEWAAGAAALPAAMAVITGGSRVVKDRKALAWTKRWTSIGDPGADRAIGVIKRGMKLDVDAVSQQVYVIDGEQVSGENLKAALKKMVGDDLALFEGLAAILGQSGETLLAPLIAPLGRSFQVRETDFVLAKKDDGYRIDISALAQVDGSPIEQEVFLTLDLERSTTSDGWQIGEKEMRTHYLGRVDNKEIAQQIPFDALKGDWGIQDYLATNTQKVEVDEVSYNIYTLALTDSGRSRPRLWVQRKKGIKDDDPLVAAYARPMLSVEGSDQERIEALIRSLKELNPKAEVEQIERAVALCTQTMFVPITLAMQYWANGIDAEEALAKSVNEASKMVLKLRKETYFGAMAVDESQIDRAQRRMPDKQIAKFAYFIRAKGKGFEVELQRPSALGSGQGDMANTRHHMGYSRQRMVVDTTTGNAPLTWSDLQAELPPITLT